MNRYYLPAGEWKGDTLTLTGDEDQLGFLWFVDKFTKLLIIWNIPIPT